MTSECAWYCADTCTPIFAALLPSLAADLAVIRLAVDAFPDPAAAGGGYASSALVTHTGTSRRVGEFGRVLLRQRSRARR